MLKLFYQSFNRVQRSEVIFFDQNMRRDNFEFFLFSALPHLLVFKSNFWTRSNINIKLEVEDGNGITSFLMWSCVVNDLLRKWFCFQHCSNVYLFSTSVLVPKQTVHLKKLKSETAMHCIWFYEETALPKKRYFHKVFSSSALLEENFVFK